MRLCYMSVHDNVACKNLKKKYRCILIMYVRISFTGIHPVSARISGYMRDFHVQNELTCSLTICVKPDLISAVKSSLQDKQLHCSFYTLL